jgi:YD repeat-containing protein
VLTVAGVCLAVVVAVLVADVWGPPLFSGALLLLTIPSAPSSPNREQGIDHRPRHQGHVDISSGLYIREDEDVVLGSGTPFVWRRTYLSGDHVSRHFGIGATHNAEWHLIGDPQRFEWAELIREDGSRIHFDRLTPGHSYGNAVFGHTSTPTEYYGALLGWTGLGWRIRLRNGQLLSFKDCGPGGESLCSLMAVVEGDGSRVLFRRDARGLVKEVQAGSDRLSLEYDEQHRIVKASDTAGRIVEYSYDAKGHVARVSANGIIRTYEYDTADQLLDIKEPGREIVNRFDTSGRLVHQTVRLPNRSDYEESFAYKVANGAVIETSEVDADSTTLYRFDAEHYVVLEVHERANASPVTVSYDRSVGEFARTMTVRCSKNGKRVSQTVEVEGYPEYMKTAAIERYCD